MSTDVKPFRIAVGSEVLEDLTSRLRKTRWPEAAPVDDWRRREALLNRFPQFTTAIDGLDIHFMHVRSPHPGAMPLILTHGWPGSVVELHKVIKPLVDPAA